MVADEQDATPSDGEDPWTLPDSSRKPIPDLVADRVLELVRAGVIPPGDRLPTEPELARRFRVARSSVRSGLQRLQAQGVVEVNRGRGWFVSASSSRDAAELMQERMAAREFDIRDVMEVRIALEGAAAGLAAVACVGRSARRHPQAQQDRPGCRPERFRRAARGGRGVPRRDRRGLGERLPQGPLRHGDSAGRRVAAAELHERPRPRSVGARPHADRRADSPRRTRTAPGWRCRDTCSVSTPGSPVARGAEAGVDDRPIAGLSTYVDVGDDPMYEDEAGAD